MQKPEIWIKHPSSGQEINVAPLLHALDMFDHPPNAPICTGIRDVIRRAIRTLSVTVHDHNISPSIVLAELYQDLYALDDIFSAMTERVSM